MPSRSPPAFTSLERKRFFALPTSLSQTAESFRTPTNKVCFLLLFGYFKARRKFFAKEFRQADVEYVTAHLGLQSDAVQIDAYDKQTCTRHQQLVLDYFGCRKFDSAAQDELRVEVEAMVRSHVRPKLILLETINILTRRKIALPTNHALAALITDVMRGESRRLLTLVREHLTERTRHLLDALLDKEEAAHDPDHQATLQRARLTLLKCSHQSTKPAKIKANVADLQTLRTLYTELEPVITALALPRDGISYYANSVIRAEVFQVARRAAEDRYLHLIAFIAHQTFKLQDTLVDALLASIQTTINSAQREHKERYYGERTGWRQSLGEFATAVDRHLLTTLADIDRIVTANNLTDATKLTMIASSLKEQEPHRCAVAEQLRRLTETTGINADADFYELLQQRSLKLQSRVADTVRCLRFDAATSSPSMIEAITHYQQKNGAVDKGAPVNFLTAREQTTVYDAAGKFRVSLYKALLFVKAAEALKAGTLNLTHSYRYRSLDDYLIPHTGWESQRATYLHRAELNRCADCHQTLDELSRTLDRHYRQTNQRVAHGSNNLLTIRPNGTFHTTTPKEEEIEAVSLARFFPERRYVSLLEVLATVNQATGFLTEFAHWQLTHVRHRPPERTFFAGVIAYGCDIGQRKIARISQQISEGELENTVNWYFSLPTIHAANDRVLSVLNRMELPNLYRRDSERLHTSSDGQKFEIAVESLNANHSFKYFGQSKGVSVYSFIDERHRLFHSTVISSAEREAAYVIDGLMHNEVVKSDIHSTDTHGYSEAVFGVMHLLGFSFAPRIKRLDEQRLYSFEKRKVYEDEGFRILPDGYIDTELIAANWDDILRFVATIKLKHATASQLFKRLNSYSKQHALYRALKEFGKIIKSMFILNYIDDVELRQSIEKQLNKIESAQKFSKAVSFGHNQEFIQSEKEEQEIAEGCRRLIKNAIICWNYLYLSQKLRDEENLARKAELIEAVTHGSVVTWQHINLHGEYDFSDEKLRDTVGLEVSKIVGV